MLLADDILHRRNHVREEGLAVVVETETPLKALRDVLADGRQGKGQVVVTSRLGQGREVDIELPGGYALTPDVIEAVRAIPGIVEARET